VIDSDMAVLDGVALAVKPAQASYTAQIGTLHFVTPKPYRPEDFPVLRAKDVLKGIIERNEYQ
jgi:hypothetical protein